MHVWRRIEWLLSNRWSLTCKVNCWSLNKVRSLSGQIFTRNSWVAKAFSLCGMKSCHIWKSVFPIQGEVFQGSVWLLALMIMYLHLRLFSVRWLSETHSSTALIYHSGCSFGPCDCNNSWVVKHVISKHKCAQVKRDRGYIVNVK